MTAKLDLQTSGKAAANVVRLRGHPLDSHLDIEVQTEVRRRLARIRDQLDLPADPSPERRAVAADALCDLDLLAAELRRWRCSPYRELQDVAVAIRTGGRRHALGRLAQLAGPVAR